MMVDLDRLAVLVGASQMEPVHALCEIFAQYGHLRLVEACLDERYSDEPHNQTDATSPERGVATASLQSTETPTPQQYLAFALGGAWPAGALEVGEHHIRLQPAAAQPGGIITDPRQRVRCRSNQLVLHPARRVNRMSPPPAC